MDSSIAMSPVVAALWNREFDRAGHLQLIASLLEHVRKSHPEEWKAVGEGRRLPEFKKLIKNLLRAADESVDHRATVSFVTQAAVDRLEALALSRPCPKGLKGDLSNSTLFGHEHATPVEVIFRTITLAENRDARIVEMLQGLCCRVLVTKEEQRTIDRAHRWTIPVSLKWKSGVALGSRTLMPELLPLVRYHEIDPALVLSLIPLSPTRADHIRRLRKLIDADKDGLGEAYAACHRTHGTSFVLSDDIYQ